MIKFTSQGEQDKWVCEFFKYKRNGYFLDIGAYDGFVLSNTYYLEKELGWKGICVEAGEKNFESLMRRRSCLCLHNAVYNVNGKVSFNEDTLYGMVKEEGKQSVMAITVDRLLRDFKVPLLIDYISLDVEGAEYIVLEKFPFDEYKSILWTIEHNFHVDGGKVKKQVREIMDENGYTLVSEGVKPGFVLWEDWFYNKEYA